MTLYLITWFSATTAPTHPTRPTFCACCHLPCRHCCPRRLQNSPHARRGGAGSTGSGSKPPSPPTSPPAQPTAPVMIFFMPSAVSARGTLPTGDLSPLPSTLPLRERLHNPQPNPMDSHSRIGNVEVGFVTPHESKKKFAEKFAD